ncbi:uncharacterized protein LOC125042447 [Penaeus chinensis]|uniref:uncharacterized protein LOC125042447 n=1 Tax=Penaeus chinensis TaxID=139456 RepID=UPI001FB84341|nr:uncharacterized protein LOC125042447 [Penaeus chinensis]
MCGVIPVNFIPFGFFCTEAWVSTSFYYFQQKIHIFSYSFTDPNVPLGDDFDWEDNNESELSGSESEDDFVPLTDMSIDSGENLAEHVRRRWDSNAPNTSFFVWRKRENDPRCCDFLGVKVPDPNVASRPEEVLSKFLTEELLENIAKEMNRYVVQNPRT